jgi:hypothetical protein
MSYKRDIADELEDELEDDFNEDDELNFDDDTVYIDDLDPDEVRPDSSELMIEDDGTDGEFSNDDDPDDAEEALEKSLIDDDSDEDFDDED